MILASPLALAPESVVALSAVVAGAPNVPMVVRMGCADEGFALRRFTFLEMTPSGRADYTCSCGWMQTSPQAGGRELLNCATWDSEDAKRRFSALVDQQPDTAQLT